ncbi:MAG: hypothetical protein Q7J78_07910 [Clostridiales bacterium]|nr:hypothetical protein [Clostridiales bacterium]
MSKKGFGLGDAVRITAAAVRAAYGDCTSAAIEGANIAARSSKIIISLIIGFLMLFTVLIASLENLIPGFKELYGMYSNITQSTHFGGPYNPGSSPETIPTTISYIFFPIPSGNSEDFSDTFGGYRYTNGQKRNHEGIDIFAERDNPLIAVEETKIIKIEANKHSLPAIK